MRNGIVIVPDDMNFMRSADEGAAPLFPNVQSLLVEQGMTMRCIAERGKCGASRANMIRGQMSFTHGITENGPPDGGWYGLAPLMGSTVFTDAAAAGIYVGISGKLENKFGKNPQLVPGVAAYAIVSGDNEMAYTDFDLFQNGVDVHYGLDAQGQPYYITDVTADRFLEMLDTAPEPFLLYWCPTAPHVPAIPAPRHAGAFASTEFWVPPSFNENVRDKPPLVASLGKQNVQLMQDKMRDRARCFLAVDEGLARIQAALEARGIVDRTDVGMMVDNRIHLAENRITGKDTHYIASVDLWCVFRGDGIIPGSVCNRIITNHDLPQTLGDRLGFTSQRVMDGRSAAPLFGNPTQPWRNATYVAANLFDGAATSEGIYTDTGWSYFEWSDGSRELYNGTAFNGDDPDPYQTSNNAGKPAYANKQATMASIIAALRNKAGAACWYDGPAP